MEYNSDYEGRTHCKLDYQICKVTTNGFKSEYNKIGTNCDLLQWDTYHWDIKKAGTRNGCLSVTRNYEFVDRKLGQSSPNIPKLPKI